MTRSPKQLRLAIDNTISADNKDNELTNNESEFSLRQLSCDAFARGRCA